MEHHHFLEVDHLSMGHSPYVACQAEIQKAVDAVEVPASGQHFLQGTFKLPSGNLT